MAKGQLRSRREAKKPKADKNKKKKGKGKAAASALSVPSFQRNPAPPRKGN